MSRIANTFLLIITTTLLISQASANPGICRFFFDQSNQNRYTCELADAFVWQIDRLEIVGDHLSGQTDANVQALRTVNCSIPLIDSVIMTKFENLVELDLRMTFVEIVSEDALGSCRQLERLLLANNSMRELPRGAFENCSRLRELNLNSNYIRQLPDGFLFGASDLRNLWFESNGQISIGSNALYGLSTLTILSLANNVFTGLSTSFLRNQSNLNYINLRNCRLEHFWIVQSMLQGLNRIVAIDLSENLFRVFDATFFAQHPSIVIAYLGGNPLKQLPAYAFSYSALVHLDLSDSHFTAIDSNAFANMQSLTTLILDRNHLESLPEGLFAVIPNINEIFLDGNRIRRLNSDAFGHMPRVVNFRIGHNELDEIQRGFFDNFPGLGFFHGEGNVCVNQVIGSADIAGHEQIEECFRNWDSPRTTATEEAITTPSSTTTTDGVAMSGGFGINLVILLAAFVWKVIV